MKAIIDCVKEWLVTSELFNNIDIRTDYLVPDNSTNYYSLEQDQTPSPLTKANVLGTKLKGSLLFTLAGRFDFDVHTDETNNKNLIEMQKIEEWIVKESIKGNYPILNENETTTGIDVTSSPFLFGIDKSTTQSRYQMQFKINYEKRLD